MKNCYCNLYNKDCFDFLSTIEDNSVSLVLIDPPYNISRETNFKNGKPKGTSVDRFINMSMDFGNWDNNEFLNLDLVIEECYRVLKSSGTIICFYDLWKISYLKSFYEKANFKQIRFIEWLKTNPVPVNSKINYLTNAREVAVVGVKGSKPIFNSEYDNGLYNFPICHDKDRFHPTQKPIVLLEEIIKKHSNENDLILDCFSGSGSTAVASHNLNRNFVGCEISKEYYDKSVKWLKEKEVVINNLED